MERKGLMYFEEGSKAAQKYMNIVIGDLKVNPSAQMLSYVLTGFFMVEYFGLPWFDVQPEPEEVREMFSDLIDRDMAVTLEDVEESEDGLLHIDYKINEAVDYMGDRLAELANDSKAKVEFIRLAKLCSAVTLAPTSKYMH